MTFQWLCPHEIPHRAYGQNDAAEHRALVAFTGCDCVPRPHMTPREPMVGGLPAPADHSSGAAGPSASPPALGGDGSAPDVCPGAGGDRGVTGTGAIRDVLPVLLVAACVLVAFAVAWARHGGLS